MLQRRHRSQWRGEAPAALAQVQRVGHHLARDGEDEGKRMIRHLVDAVVRDVAHRDATLACGGRVHIVVTDAVAHDGFRFRHGVNHLGVHGRELGNHRICISHEFGEFSGRTLFFKGNNLDPLGSENGLLGAEIGEGVVGDGNLGHGRGYGVIRR